MGVQQFPWTSVDHPVSGLPTNAPNKLQVKRETIPIIFVPGVMGSRLRLKGTSGTGEVDGDPNLRWDPKGRFLWKYYSGVTPARRKLLLLGNSGSYNPDFLEVDNDAPTGNGYRGLMEEYRVFLEELHTHDWGALGKLFVFPVYGFGYNWSASNRTSGAKLAARITEIIAEGKKVTGTCEKVILVTHSMGGLVARAAMKLSGAEGKVLGVVHGVQPAYGSPTAYTRMKAGFEGGMLTSNCLGPSGRDLTALLANSMGGLQLLPGKHYTTSRGSSSWLDIPGRPHALPLHNDPFNEIYRVRAMVDPEPGKGPSQNTYWGLVDPALLRPVEVKTKPKDASDDEGMLTVKGLKAAWAGYLTNLAEAESLLDDLGTYRHPKTWWFNGSGLTTAETVGFEISSNWMRSEHYPSRGFRGFLRDAQGKSMQAQFQDPVGSGDGTVPTTSGSFNGGSPDSPSAPGHRTFAKLEHQPAYEEASVKTWATAAITAIAGLRFKELKG
jgi:pimeloyl-ACP methyl ester carboxylesterase